MKKKLLLVLPKNFALDFGDMRFGRSFIKRSGGIMNASLATIAALTPPEEFEIRIVDERLETIDFDAPYDLVGITAILTQFDRAK